MRPLLNVEEYDSYIRRLKITSLNEEELAKAKQIFDERRKEGVIIKGAFQDDLWIATDEVRVISLDFRIDSATYRKGAGGWANCDRLDFIRSMKAYVMFKMGKFVLSFLQDMIRELKRLSLMDLDAALSAEGERFWAEFLSFLPGESEERDLVTERFEEQGSIFSTGDLPRRQLGDFRNYLRFDRKLREYWANAQDVQKERYFPIYLWWNLTATLPLRPTEFLLTPADCLKKVNGTYILSIRRTLRKKKGRGRVTYKIDTDYEINRYEIPDELGRMIEAYQSLHPAADKSGVLFPAYSSDSFRLRRIPHMTYPQLRVLLQKFLKEELGEDALPIRLGDTRHLAMINLMLSGGSPTICKALAGHEDINVSAHYYSNLSSIIESAVYERFRSDGMDAVLDGRMYFPLSLPSLRVRVQDGWCDYPPVRDGDVRECLKNYKNGAFPGDCVNCPHFFPEQKGLRLKIVEDRKLAVDESAAFLIQMIEQVRKGLNFSESIASAMARLQDDSRRYAAALRGKYETEANDGTP